MIRRPVDPIALRFCSSSRRSSSAATFRNSRRPVAAPNNWLSFRKSLGLKRLDLVCCRRIASLEEVFFRIAQ